MIAPAASANPKALPLDESPTADFIWLGIVMIRMADHIILVENQKKLSRIWRNVDIRGRTKVLGLSMEKILSIIYLITMNEMLWKSLQRKMRIVNWPLV